jgi:hypothetical protein
MNLAKLEKDEKRHYVPFRAELSPYLRNQNR